jgi:hypothetical protein
VDRASGWSSITPVKQLLLDSSLDGGVAETGLQQLSQRDDAMLAGGDPGHLLLR